MLFAVDPSGIPPWLGLVLIPVLVAVNAFFVSAEFALVAVRRTRVEELVNEGRPRAKALLAAVDDLNASVAAAQVGITVASLALGVVSEPALAGLVRPLFDALPDSWRGPLTHTLSIALTLLIVTYLHVVFGEQMPKLVALQASERVALFVTTPLWWFTRLTRPAVWLMNGSSALFLRPFGYRPAGEEGEVHSVEELRLLVEDTEEAGLIDPEAADFVLNVFALSDKTVQDAMVPWDRVMALELTTPPDKILEAVREGAHTRMPVYRGTPDQIVGIVNTKDLFYLFSLRGVVVLEDALYDAQFLPPDAPVSVALRLFRRTHRPMAVVRDPETKRALGILTLEDVLEEIIGDIEDEQDDPGRRRELLAKLRRRGGPQRK
ncbi:MAG TPA: hemolysin family protein [Fimbriiglobus sp.]|nr:hemolysin family protein [Fimbriiglobus sp.]